MKSIHPLLVTRGLDPPAHLPRVEMDCRVKPWDEPGNGEAQVHIPVVIAIWFISFIHRSTSIPASQRDEYKMNRV
jgi:hypothetical protein